MILAAGPGASETAQETPRKNTHEMLGGNVTTVGSESFRCPKVQFQSGYVGKTVSGLHDTTFQSRPS